MIEFGRAASATCSCRHPSDCRCHCHERYCDPAVDSCATDYRPDHGGLTPWGCHLCTPGQGLEHLLECPVAVGVPAVAVSGIQLSS